MTDGDRKRRAIFDKFADNLELLIEKDILKDTVLKYNRTYICPICTEHFSYDDLNQKCKNPLTLEDAPPKSLGGKANILTCKRCNNSCGQTIDYHLTERMRELDRSQFLPNTEFNAKFERNGVIVQGKVKIEKDGKMRVEHKNKINNPSWLETFIKSLLPDKIIKLSFLKNQVDPFKLQLALLKTGFLLTFSKFGYAFILDQTYNVIRQQLKDPDNPIYPTEFWLQIPYPKELYGVPFIIEHKLEAIYPIFPLITKSCERPFATIIPLPIRPIENIISELQNTKYSSIFDVLMDPMGPNTNYLTNIEAIVRMMKWIDSKKK